MTPVESLVTGQGELTLSRRRAADGAAQDQEAAARRRGRHADRTDYREGHSRQERLPFATRDAHGRLRVGAAIGATGDFLERAAELVKAGVDVIVIDIAHGHSVVMARAIDAFKKQIPDSRTGRRQRRHCRRA